MIIGLLFIIAGVLLCFTGIGLVVGIPMVLIGFVILIFSAVGGVAGSLFPRRSSSISYGPMDYQNRRTSFVGSLILVLIGLALIYAVSTMHAKAQDNESNSTPVDKAYYACLVSTGMQGQYSSQDGGRSALRLMQACQSQSDDYIGECAQKGSSSGDCGLVAGELAQTVIIKVLGQ